MHSVSELTLLLIVIIIWISRHEKSQSCKVYLKACPVNNISKLLTIFFGHDWRTNGGHNLCLFSCQDYQRVVSYQDCDSTDLEIIFKPLPQQILRDQNINRMKIWKITQVAFLNDLFHFSLSVHWINWTLLIFFSLESNISRITDLKLIGCDSSQMPLIGGFSQIKLISSPSHNVTAFSEYFSCTNIPFLGNFCFESWKLNTWWHNFLE